MATADALVRLHLVFRALARISSLVSIGLVSLLFVGELLVPGAAVAPTPAEWVGLGLFPVSVCIGMIVGWRREGWGGALTAASFVAFYVWNRAVRGSWPRGPYFALVAAPRALFLLAWALAPHRRRAVRPAAR